MTGPTGVPRPYHIERATRTSRIATVGSLALSSTVLGGSVAVRMCVLSFRTERRHVDDAIAAIRAAL